jgi:hypothetical protein
VETVAWIDARFDLFAGSFVLIALLCVLRYARSVRTRWLLLSLGAGAVAVLVKESAFALPLLSLCLAAFCAKESRRPLLRGCVWISGLCAGLFAYRWFAIGGIGGYATGGIPEVMHFDVIRFAHALLAREYAILLFPVNWSLPLETPVRVALLTILPGFMILGCLTRLQGRLLLGASGLILCAALPVEHLLMLGTTLSGTRLLYLPALGWAILCGVLVSALPRTTWRFAALLWMLTVQVLMLEHNLRAWNSVPQLAQTICADFGQNIASLKAQTVQVFGLPQTRTGVVFLQNGFPQCVEMNSGVSHNRIQVVQGALHSTEPAFAWHEPGLRIEAIKHAGSEDPPLR